MKITEMSETEEDMMTEVTDIDQKKGIDEMKENLIDIEIVISQETQKEAEDRDQRKERRAAIRSIAEFLQKVAAVPQAPAIQRMK